MFVAPLFMGLLAGCDPQPTSLPTAQAVQDADAVDQDVRPPLYQLLYDTPLLPAPTPTQQQVRMLVWLRHMDLRPDQLDQLSTLRSLVEERRGRITQAERALADQTAAREQDIYQAIWEALARGAPVDAPELSALTDSLQELRAGGRREQGLLNLRIEGMQSILDAERPFLSSLSPQQEGALSHSVFLLRRHLDPVANPGDFNALVGTLYEPGQYDVLTRGAGRADVDPLDIGALWADEPSLEGTALHDARREVLLYLVMIEPALDPAITAARALQPAPADPR